MEPNPFRSNLHTSTLSAQDIDQGLRNYMLGVYNNMALGVALTAIASWLVFNLSFTTSEGQTAFTGIGQMLFLSPMHWVLMLSPLAMVLVLSFGINRLAPGTARLLFFVYAAMMGVSIATIFALYSFQSIARVFFITAAAFGGLSLYGYTTKRNLSAFGSFLIMGLIGVLIAMVVNWFLQSSALQFVISVCGVLVFAGLTAYDTQKIKEMYLADDHPDVAGRKSVMGALALYLDFINLFLLLLHLFGRRE
ncbi:MAG: Bax inhibitor-1/YccA family protein [Hyphomicrobiales bacterium]|nr:Bax inhibitor-1/YccA family protein [Hyphomicrobiales bacterium]MCY4032525.1 Bax inhibitor-1/YccA family protein [Hyphomicrobiales bacterium]MCY4038832.1 Bax inhibitor-1/YccA family protein [Hyphomicrobiales bacterium]